MALIDYSSINVYPTCKIIGVGTSAQQITLPSEASKVSIGCDAALYFSTDVGVDGNSFDTGSGGDIADYGFVAANNYLPIEMEKGQQSTRNLCVAAQTGTATVYLIIEKR
tara:strand:- start:943 stop:1272 length:330 start_codon:yes stop_codon:yes gene_type:complete